jgi:hypothetical protein
VHASRFASLSRIQALVVCASLACAILLSVIGLPIRAFNPGLPQQATPASAIPVSDAKNDDLRLYAAINARMARGESYYVAAADEQRKGNYPLRPFITMRPPTLAAVSATLGTPVMTGILFMLVLATVLAWRHRLRNQFGDPERRTIALGLLLAGMMAAFWREFIVLHELWAGILLALAFALHRPNKWLPSVVIAACALMIRELSLPFLLLMGAFAIHDRRWREAAALAAIVAAFAVVMSIHAQHVAAVVSAADPASPGWTQFNGWDGFRRAMQMPGALRAFPDWVGSMAVILCLFGWLSWRTRTGLFGTLFFAGYGVAFMVLGRPNNFYWGFMVVPTFLIGLAFLPQAFTDLRGAIRAKLDFAAA